MEVAVGGSARRSGSRGGASHPCENRPNDSTTRSYIEANTRERARLRALVEGIDDETLTYPVNEYWTVAGVLGHIAYWDIRILVLAEKIAKGEPWAPGDAEPEGDWLNDTTRPLIHAIAPRVAAQLALQTAEKCDALVAALPLKSCGPAIPTARSAVFASSTAASTWMRSRPPSKREADPA